MKYIKPRLIRALKRSQTINTNLGENRQQKRKKNTTKHMGLYIKKTRQQVEEKKQ